MRKLIIVIEKNELERKSIIRTTELDGWKYMGTHYHIDSKLITLTFIKTQ